MQISTATTLTFGPMKIHTLVKRCNFNEIFHNVCAGIINERLVGPYVLPNRINAAQYLEFLNVLEEQLDVEVPLYHHILLGQNG